MSWSAFCRTVGLMGNWDLKKRGGNFCWIFWRFGREEKVNLGEMAGKFFWKGSEWMRGTLSCSTI